MNELLMFTTLIILTSIGLIWALVVAVFIRSWGFFFRGIVLPTAMGALVWMTGFFVAGHQYPPSYTGHEGIIVLAVSSLSAYLAVTASLAINLLFPILNSKGRLQMKRAMPQVFRISRVLGLMLIGCFATVAIRWIFDL